MSSHFLTPSSVCRLSNSHIGDIAVWVGARLISAPWWQFNMPQVLCNQTDCSGCWDFFIIKCRWALRSFDSPRPFFVCDSDYQVNDDMSIPLPLLHKSCVYVKAEFTCFKLKAFIFQGFVHRSWTLTSANQRQMKKLPLVAETEWVQFIGATQ
jgi:hypothetical protein